MSAYLRFESVCYSYGERSALRDVDFAVRAGEMVALLGPNGSGKTTLLRLASGVLEPRSGRAMLGGRDVRRYGRRELARRLSVLSQEMDVPSGWSVGEVVSLGRTPHIRMLASEMAADRAAVAAALRAMGTEALADRLYETLSGGQKQRVVMATTLAQQPEVLLLDEPTAHLDLRYRIELMDSVRQLASDSGVTVLAALHDPSLAALYFERLVILHEGRVVADGTPREVLTEELLEEVYEVPVRVSYDSELGAPLVHALPAHLGARPRSQDVRSGAS